MDRKKEILDRLAMLNELDEKRIINGGNPAAEPLFNDEWHDLQWEYQDITKYEDNEFNWCGK